MSSSSANIVSIVSIITFRKCDVVNRGLSGYNTRWAKLVLPRIVPNHGASHPPIAAVIVFFGANDSSLEGKTSLAIFISLM